MTNEHSDIQDWEEQVAREIPLAELPPTGNREAWERIAHDPRLSASAAHAARRIASRAMSANQRASRLPQFRS